MDESLHHIRLLAGLEIDPGRTPERFLDRKAASNLAGHLATDLARVLPEAEQTLLVAGAGLFEPSELLRPGLPVWQVLEDLAADMIRQSGFRPQVMALGAHNSRMPHEDLQPPPSRPQGQFIALPLLLVCPAEIAESIETRLEAQLFESGSIDPPALALLHAQAGIESVHGQLLTLHDLIALQHVQFDSAGLGAFWPVVEHVLLTGGETRQFNLPAGLEAAWQPASERLDIRFVSLDQTQLATTDYLIWMRALRMLTALLDAHGVDWQPMAEGQVTFDRAQQMMIETAGPVDWPSGLTIHHDSELGPVAWTVVEDGRMMHLYPLRPEAADSIERELAARLPARITRCKTILTDPATGKLVPAKQ